MEDNQPWIDILNEQPAQGERVFVKIIGGMRRITSYDRFRYDHWCITHFKRLPPDTRDVRLAEDTVRRARN